MKLLGQIVMSSVILTAVACSSQSAADSSQSLRLEDECREYYDTIVKELSDASTYYGRSNYANGDIKAARYIIDRIIECGGIPASESAMAASPAPEKTAFPEYKSPVKPYDGPGRWKQVVGSDLHYTAFLQNFCYDLNVMRGAMSLKLDGKELRPTVDFVVKEFSPSCKGIFKVKYLEDAYYSAETFVSHLNSGAFRDAFVVVDWARYKTLPFESEMETYFPYLLELENVGGIILKDYSDSVQFPYFKGRAHKVSSEPVLVVNSTFPSDAQKLEIDIESEMIKGHDSHNVVAFMPGTGTSEECITFVAHYDHLGMMGKDYVCPGANDNASGVAMLLSLMKYWQVTEHETPLQFIFFDAEESNLLGSFYYTENPVIPLEKIKCVIDCDMVGDNGDSILYECDENGRRVIDSLMDINDLNENGFSSFTFEEPYDCSDHYPFMIKGIPSVFLETVGDFEHYYHTPEDTYDHTTTDNFSRLFRMLTGFVE